MHLICDRLVLERTLRMVRHAVSTRSMLPILSCVLLSTEQGHLKVSATNLEIGFTCGLDARVTEEGRVAVPAFALLEQVQMGSGASIEMRTEKTQREDDTSGEKLLIEGQRTLDCLNASSFPAMRSLSAETLFACLPASLFRHMIARVAFAASQDENDVILSSVWFQLDSQQFTVAAGGNPRCAIFSIPTPCPGKNRDVLLVPTRSLTILARLLPRQGEVKISVERKGLLCLSSAAGDYYIRLSGYFEESDHFLLPQPVAAITQRGTCRPFQPLIPKQWQALIICQKKALLEALAPLGKAALPARCMVQEEAGGLVFTVQVYDKEIKIYHIPVVRSEGTRPPPLWINVRFLAQAITCSGTPSTFVLALGDTPNSPILLRWIDGDVVQEAYSYVCMPFYPYALSRHPRIRQHFSDAATQVLEELYAEARYKGIEQPSLKIWEDVLGRIVYMLDFAYLPPEQAIQEASAHVQEMSTWSDWRKQNACERHFDQLTENLALGAFATGGCCLALPGLDNFLSFNAAALQAALARVKESGTLPGR
jgi:hypothetical protein